MQSFTKSAKHAKFLARNETAMATTSYLVAKYKSEGITSFIWNAIIDGRERPLHGNKGDKNSLGEWHKGLNGQIFRFDEPPIIDIRTGQRGLPGQTYNCRCTMTPVINKEFWENRKKLYKKKNGLLNILKNFIRNP